MLVGVFFRFFGGVGKSFFNWTLDFQFDFWIFNSNVIRCVGLLVGIICGFARGEGKSFLNWTLDF